MAKRNTFGIIPRRRRQALAVILRTHGWHPDDIRRALGEKNLDDIGLSSITEIIHNLMKLHRYARDAE